ncbi:MAG: acyltransferase [Prevotella sp.]|nr:acyltransferase [Prevotella sp.]MDY3853300.1 acyltransferase [Prevotella sp.]
MERLLRRIRMKWYRLTHPFLWGKELRAEGLFEVSCQPRLLLGRRVSIGHNVFLQAEGKIVLSDDVILSRGVHILTGSLDLDRFLETSCKEERPHICKSVTIGKGTWIGANSIVLQGVTIAENCVVAAGSVVNKDLDIPGGVYAGVPAKLVRMLK